MTLVLFFALAAAHEALLLRWHAAREARQVARMLALGTVLEVSAWVPLWFALADRDVSVLVASVLGSNLGAVLGMRRRALPTD